MLRHAMYNLRGGFLIRPLTIALTLGGAGAFLSWLEEEFPAASAWVPTVLFPSHADPQVAQVILAGIAASIMTVVSIVFAILLMTLTLASMQFSPRIIVSFSRDRVTQWTLGIFLGTFSYCMAALPAATSSGRSGPPKEVTRSRRSSWGCQLALGSLPRAAALFLQVGESYQNFFTMLVGVYLGEYFGHLAFWVDDEGVPGSEFNQSEIRQRAIGT